MVKGAADLKFSGVEFGLEVLLEALDVVDALALGQDGGLCVSDPDCASHAQVVCFLSNEPFGLQLVGILLLELGLLRFPLMALFLLLLQFLRPPLRFPLLIF